MNTYYSESNLEKLNILNEPFKNELTGDSPRLDFTSPLLKIPLRAHQAASVQAMIQKETEFSKGKDISGETVFSSWAILGDGVGVGKSFTVLSHIAYLKQKESIEKETPKISTPCSPYMYSLKQTTDISHCNTCLIVVPHTLFKQWSTYIKDQTNLKTHYITTKKILDSPSLIKNIYEADVVLISNTLYGYLIYKIGDIQFKRAYIDEVDSIHITGSNPLPTAKFIWLITASWSNLLFPQIHMWISHSLFQQYMFCENSRFHPDFIEQYRPFYTSTRHNYSYYTHKHHLVSLAFFKKLLLPNHSLRANLVIRSSLPFIRESIQLPQLFRQTIICRSPISHQVVMSVISPEVRGFLHAGDIQSALQHLGVTEESQTNLIEAVTENRKKELDRVRKTYEFKSSLEYSTPQAKEQALANLKQKISHLEEQIKSISERLENFQKEACPICFDEPVEALLTNCCQRIFCASCILTSLTRNPTCPMCRHPTNPSHLKKISLQNTMVTKKKEEELSQPPLKREALLRLLKENPKGKFLIFSRYDNPFTQIGQDLENESISVQEVKGNKDVIASTLRKFQNGETRCLLLNSIHAGAGLTITAATHVILLHAMSLEEEKQIIGRAYRLGRKEPLTIYKLVHPDEMETTN